MMNSPLNVNPLKEQGFTLVEVMVSIVVAMTVLAGLMLTFMNQSNQYQYQNKRIDASQDLEFAIKFIEEDLRSALIGGESIVITNEAAPDPYTSALDFVVWDLECTSCPAAVVNNGRVSRKYTYDFANQSLKYDRETSTASNDEILPNVTFFKVFDDYTSARAGYADIPSALPQISVAGPSTAITTSGYTILIEVAVKAGYKGASPVDVRGNTVTGKRIWRYIQVYPMAAVP